LKFVRFVYYNASSYGVLINGEILDLLRLSKIIDVSIPTNIEKLVLLGQEDKNLLEELITNLTKSQIKKAKIRKGEFALKAPIPYPPKIVCLGLNYRTHAEEAGIKIPDEPVLFMKPRTSIIGPYDHIIKPNFVKQLDYEVELAIIIGKRGKNIPLQAAREHVFGYTVMNDVSARDIQFKDGQWTRGKSFDTFAPMGPCITTAEQMGDVDDLQICTRVNDEIRQNSSTRNMVFDVSQIIHRVSRVMTLEPCDIIATGTPSGVGFYMKPEPKFLMSGDVVEVEIENIGTLKNSIVEE
jgi:2-keto-4-pentenoate hydratase/2-oxohepta-3-ene-1,7-dioic acid hydratase in catechol pathway